MLKKVKVILCLIGFVMLMVGTNFILNDKETAKENRKEDFVALEDNHSSGEKEEEIVKTVTSDTFEEEVLKGEQVVLIDFYATWCIPCQKLSPIVSEIAIEHKNLKVVKIDIDENLEFYS